MKNLKHIIFWPILCLLLVVVIFSLTNTTGFLASMSSTNQWILTYFGWAFATAVLVFLFIVIMAYISPLGNVRIGGRNAQPMFSKWRWFSITLCTTVATGILFWGTSEPLFHFHNPPPGLDILPGSAAAGQFAMSTMFLHWTFIPYGIYTVTAITFALVYYNMKQPFSLGSLLFPLLGNRAHGGLSNIVDGISLFSLIAGMAASLGAGLIILAGGLERLSGIEYSKFSLALVALLVVGTFILSAISGLMKGIRILSDINIKLFITLALFMAVFGPLWFMIKLGVAGFWEFISHFFSRSLLLFDSENTSWAEKWTVFNWANWLAWTPITAVFLGRITVGRTVREVIRFNLLYPALFSCAWMVIFSGISLQMDQVTGNPMYTVLITEGGPSKVVFQILHNLPMRQITSIVFLFAAFLSYVTAADSNTSAMSGISAKGISPVSPEPSYWIKIIWGSLIGIIAWVMIAFSGEGADRGLAGIRMLSNLGGLPALFLVILVSIALSILVIKSFKPEFHLRNSSQKTK